MSNRNHRRWSRYNRGEVPWFLREVGGAPYWLLVACGVVAVGILLVVLFR